MTVLLALTLSPALVQAAGDQDPPGALDSPYGADRFGNAPPAAFSFAWPSTIRLGDAVLGDLDSAEFNVAYVENIRAGATWDWLVGAHWRRFQFDRPEGSPLPDALQGAAVVLGAHLRIHDRWRARVEIQPGVYSDFEDVSGADVNAPALIEVAYRIHDRLEVGLQVNVDAFREFPVIATPGVSWRLDERWLLSLWVPRPQIEFALSSHWTVFAGATLAGGSFRVAEDFGRSAGRGDLAEETVDFREIRVGGGLRFTVLEKFACELGAGWMTDRRFHFPDRDLLANGDGAPYAHVALGAAW